MVHVDKLVEIEVKLDHVQRRDDTIVQVQQLRDDRATVNFSETNTRTVQNFYVAVNEKYRM